MITKNELLQLKTKILPKGANAVLDFLAARSSQVEETKIVLENVPLLIIGRLGMILRLQGESGTQKVSVARDIIQKLQVYFINNEKLYLYVNLPELHFPAEVTNVLNEVDAIAHEKEMLQGDIDKALDSGNRELFLKATAKLVELEQRAKETSL